MLQLYAKYYNGQDWLNKVLQLYNWKYKWNKGNEEDDEEEENSKIQLKTKVTNKIKCLDQMKRLQLLNKIYK